MSKYGILLVAFFVATHLSTLSSAQDITPQAMIQAISPINKALARLEGILEVRHADTIDAHNEYVENPNSHTYAAFVQASAKELQAMQQFNALVSQAK